MPPPRRNVRLRLVCAPRLHSPPPADVSPPGSTVSTRRSAAAAAGGGKSGKFTWQEVAQHNNAESAWVIVEGKAYDITRECRTA